MTEGLKVEREGAVEVLTLSRPSVRNALNTALLAELARALTEADADPGVRLMLVRGEDGHFAAGADIDEIAGKTTVDGASDPRKQYWHRIQHLEKPLIAAVEGYCLGGGCELALSADLMVVSRQAALGQPEIRLGLIPGAGGLHRLALRLGKARSMRLALTGEHISGEQAYEWGLASHLCEVGEASEVALTLASKLSQGAPLAQRLAKAAVVMACEGQHEAGFAWERSAFETLLSSDDKAEGIAAFKAKRKATFQGK